MNVWWEEQNITKSPTFDNMQENIQLSEEQRIDCCHVMGTYCMLAIMSATFYTEHHRLSDWYLIYNLFMGFIVKIGKYVS